ncbi:MAG: hypothetical protein ACI8PQ_003320 [Planctomycetota bacterium]|jgi:hypothetical protein
MSRPSFFIVGAPKCGTTSLHAYIGQHPQLFLCEPKEPHYFGEVRLDVMPRLSEQEYLDLFDAAGEGAVCGEASTGYLYSKQAAAEIHDFGATSKIVVLLRNPVSRAYSHYWHNILALREDLDFDAALGEEQRRVSAGETYHCHYVRCGLYGEQLARYIGLFGEENVHVILFEDLVSDPGSVCRGLFEFLGVEHEFPVDVSRVHNPGGAQRSRRAAELLRHRSILKAPIKMLLPLGLRQRIKSWLQQRNRRQTPPMASDTRIRLLGEFAADRERCAQILHRDLSSWMR